MGREPTRLKVTSDSEIGRLLDAASSAPLLLEKDGEVYRLSREEGMENIWAGYDPERVRKAIKKTAGSWADIDTDALIADIYRDREEGSRPSSRP